MSTLPCLSRSSVSPEASPLIPKLQGSLYFQPKACLRALGAGLNDTFASVSSHELYHSPLRLHIRLNVALGRRKRSVSSQHLNVSDRRRMNRAMLRCFASKMRVN